MASGGADNYLLVAAIDFGTTFSGYAFSFRATKDDPELPEKMRTNKSWGESLGFQSYKTPSSVLTKRSGEFLAFGFEAEQKYGHGHENEDDEDELEGDGVPLDMLLFRQFKMILLDSENVKLTAKIKSVDGVIEKPAIDIFVHALRYLKDHMLDAIKLESGKKPDTNLIRWVITVPAIWSEQSKQFMREAVFRAGCTETKDSRHLVIALEPEAASLCCRRLKIAQYADPDGVDFPVGTKYLVLDCGGGTIDITAHEMELDRKVKELHRASGGPWGGTQVDANFHDLMESALGTEFLKLYQEKYPCEWLRFLTDFEKIKKSFKPDGSSKLNLTIPFSMSTLFVQMQGKSIDKHLRKSSCGVTFANGMIVIKHEAARKLFTPVIDSIVQHTKRLLQNSKLKGIRYILMVGGFSECNVLQDAIRENFEKNHVNVLIPNEAQLAIIKGAVMFGHRPDEIGSRVARYSYGIEKTTNFEKGIHAEKYKVIIEGTEKCKNVFDCYVTQDDVVKVGQQKTNTYKIPHAQRSKVNITLYYLDGIPTKPVQYTTDSRIVKLGSVQLASPSTTPGRKMHVKTTFGSTEIEIEGIDESSGQKVSGIMDFLLH